MFRYRLNRKTVKLAKTLVLTAAAGLVVFGFAPAPTEKATPPVFTDPQPAKNPTGLSLTVDPQKVLGWISGTEDHSGQAVQVSAGDRDGTVIVQDDNTFTWHYRVDEPVTATFTVGQWSATELLEPIEPDRLLRRRSHGLPPQPETRVCRVSAAAGSTRRVPPDRRARGRGHAHVEAEEDDHRKAEAKERRFRPHHGRLHLLDRRRPGHLHALCRRLFRQG